jgi:hypothetical protein
MERSVRKIVGVLVEWLQFVNGERESLPGVRLAFIQRNQTYAKDLREQAATILRAIAKANGAMPKRPWVDLLQLELPPRPRRLLIGGNYFTGITLSIREGEAPLDALIAALEQGVDRLRLCDCRNLFVASNRRRKYCSPACRQKKFSGSHTEAERERKKQAYHDHQAHNRRAREARKKGDWLRRRDAILH